MDKYYCKIKLSTASVGVFHLLIGYIAIFLCSFVQFAKCRTTVMSPITTIDGYCVAAIDLQFFNCSDTNLPNLGLLTEVNDPSIVTTLDLSNNLLQTIDARTFIDFKTLTTLFLQWNQISFIHPDAFEGLDNLQSLYLTGNSLQNIASSIFAPIWNLHYLDLSSNNFGTLQQYMFPYLINLKHLNLEYSNISYIESPGVFQGLQSLESLNLAGNSFAYLQDTTFQGIENTLKHLNLSNVGIRSLYSTAVPPVNEIIGNNEASTTTETPTVFLSPLVNLLTLDISHNQLMTISNVSTRHLREEMTNLRSLNASHNPMHCDCIIQDFLIWIENLAFASVNTMPFCYFPQELSNINLLNSSLLEVISRNCTLNNAATHPVVADVSELMQKLHTTTSDPNKSLMAPPPYNPMLGWYTAAFLGAILILFLLGLLMDKLKRKYYLKLKKKLFKIEKQERLERKLKNASNMMSDNMVVEVKSTDRNKNTDDTRTVLCSISANNNNDNLARNDLEHATETLEGALGIHIDILDVDIKIKKTRTPSITSNTSQNMKLAQENTQRNLILCDARQPMLNKDNVNDNLGLQTSGYNAMKRNSIDARSALNPPLELVPGITILEINPECPLHGVGGHHNHKNNFKPNGDVPKVHKHITSANPTAQQNSKKVTLSTNSNNNVIRSTDNPLVTSSTVPMVHPHQSVIHNGGAVPKKQYYAETTEHDGTSETTRL